MTRAILGYDLKSQYPYLSPLESNSNDACNNIVKEIIQFVDLENSQVSSEQTNKQTKKKVSKWHKPLGQVPQLLAMNISCFVIFPNSLTLIRAIFPNSLTLIREKAEAGRLSAVKPTGIKIIIQWHFYNQTISCILENKR